jgi:hypothetical protein
VKLPAAIAAQRVKYIARQTFRVHSHEDAFITFIHVAKNERDVFMSIDIVPVSNNAPDAELGR